MSPYEIKPGLTVYRIFGIKTPNPKSIPIRVLAVNKCLGGGYRVIYQNGDKYDTEGLVSFCRNHELEPY